MQRNRRALFFIFFVTLQGFVYTGFGQHKKQGAVGNKSQVTKNNTLKQELAEGKLLIAKSDCFACHKPDSKLVGPSYADVAKKYKGKSASVDLLAKKIIEGGSGNWGDIPMSPHTSISIAEARKMVRYILSISITNPSNSQR